MNDYQIVHNAKEQYFDFRNAFGGTVKRMHYEDSMRLAASIRMQAYVHGYCEGYEAARNSLSSPRVSGSTLEIGA